MMPTPSQWAGAIALVFIGFSILWASVGIARLLGLI